MDEGRNEGCLILVSGATGQQGGAVAALRGEHPGLVSYEQYLRADGWENAEAPPKG
jgi:hypothetical protein